MSKRSPGPRPVPTRHGVAGAHYGVRAPSTRKALAQDRRVREYRADPAKELRTPAPRHFEDRWYGLFSGRSAASF